MKGHKEENGVKKRSQVLIKLVPIVLSYAKKYKGLLVILGILLIATNSIALSIPVLMKKIVDGVVLKGLTGRELTYLCVGMILWIAFKNVIDYFSDLFTTYISQKLTIDVRKDFFSHLVSLPLKFFNNAQSGDLISRGFNDVGRIQGTLIIGTFYFVKDILFSIGLLIIIFYTSWKASIIFLGGILLIGIFTEFLRRKIRELSKVIQKKMGELNTNFLESLSLIKEVKLFLQERRMVNNFLEKNQDFLKTLMYQTKFNASSGPVHEFIFTLIIISIMWLAGMLKGEITPGTVVSLFIYLQYASGPINGIAGFIVSLQHTLASGERILEILSIKPEILDEGSPLPKKRWDINLINVSFNYNGGKHFALQDINLEIKAGETVAIVGHNGSGKTSLATLLVRLYENNFGEIQIDGINLNNFSLRSVREEIRLISQNPSLFDGTVYENIAFGKFQTSLEEVIEKTKMIHLHGIITGLPDGYSTLIGERGVKLSGGERQSIAIARIILSDPALLILDEATSHLDPKIEANVYEAILNLRKKRTTIIVTHRINGVIRAERIIAMEKGYIKEIGTFEELCEKRGCFYKLFQNQMESKMIPCAI